MFKRLYFYFWVSPDFKTNIAVKTHAHCLKHYIDFFDDLNFIVSLDNKYDTVKINEAIGWIDNIVDNKTYNIDIIDNNPDFGECSMLFNKIIPKIIKKDDDLCFFSHGKGTTNVSNQFLNKESVLRWVISMYYYSFENFDAFLKENIDWCLCGPLKTKFHNTNLPHTTIKNHQFNYPGAFYWINTKNILNNLYIPINKLTDHVNRFFAEDFPFFLMENKIFDSMGGKYTINTQCDLYHLESEKWKKYLENYGNAQECFDFQNDILNKINYIK